MIGYPCCCNTIPINSKKNLLVCIALPQNYMYIFLYSCVRELHLVFVTKLSLCSPLVLALKNTNLSRNCPSASCSWCDMVSLSRLLQCKVKVCPLEHEQWAVVQGSQENSYQADGMQSPKGVQGCLMFMMSVIHHLSTTIKAILDIGHITCQLDMRLAILSSRS